MLERYQVIETLLPNEKTKGAAHRGEEGRHIEALVRSFLNKHLPSHLRAVSGFILRPSTKTGESDLSRVNSSYDKHSNQLDVIVYDFASFPVFEQFEEFAIVPPEGVIAVISVKKTLYIDQLENELKSLRSVIELCRAPDRRAPFTSIFCFASANATNPAEKAFEIIKRVHSGHRFDEMITELSVLPSFTMLKLREDGSTRRGFTEYVYVDTDGHPDIGLQRILNSTMSVYYDATRGSTQKRPGFVSFEEGIFREAPCIGFVKQLE